MLYLVYQGKVISIAGDFEPARPERWRRGQILYFSIDRTPLADGMEEALLVERPGCMWSVRILAVSRPREAHQSQAGVVAYLLGQRDADPRILPDFEEPDGDVAAFPRRRQPDSQSLGAARRRIA